MAQWFGPNGEENCRSASDAQEFGLMLGAIADLYLTAFVLILLDGSYASRFWVRQDLLMFMLHVHDVDPYGNAVHVIGARLRRR